MSNILGIDLGSNSLGVALVSEANQKILLTAVRVFPAGTEGDTENGREEPRSAARRNARLARRQTDRRRRRLNKVFRLLQQVGLMPSGKRSDVLPDLQSQLQQRYSETTVLPYFLRARALDMPLEPHELGRALYHIAQRRGFLSNRLGSRKEDEQERGVVKASINSLAGMIAESGARTLGEFLAKTDPAASRLRHRYTHRSMYQEEFEKVWSSQARFHPTLLTDPWKEQLANAIFYQRPLKDQSHLVGFCELEPTQRRAPLRSLAAQRLRVLGFVNNLRVALPDGTERTLDDRERSLLLMHCERNERISFAKVRKTLGLGDLRFTIEHGGEKNVPGNLTAARIRAAAGEWWDSLTPLQREDLVEDIGDGKRNPTDEDLVKCASNKWKLPPEAASAIGELRLPEGYARFSLRTLKRILPHVEKGLTVEEAKIIEFPEHVGTREPLPYLPPVKSALPEIRNPAVLRALTELRKTVNAIIRRFGKPDGVRIELARDLKKSRDERQREANRNRQREKLRQIAVDELRKYDAARFAEPKRIDIEKYLLAMEARWTCPYTASRYGMTDVFGDYPQVDIEHIIPYSRCLDDSFLNKTLAYRGANMEKGRMTPREWLASTGPERFQRMISLVQAFDPRFEVAKKLKRFGMELSDASALLKEFTERQLQETRYATKLAARYLGLLFGGVVDACGERRVLACAGGVTAKLRRAWDLDRILSKEPKKSRDDHRHHGIDAIAVALSNAKRIEHYASVCEDAERSGRRRISLAAPWPDFGVNVRDAIEKVIVSHRPMRHLSGALHEETNYSRPRIGPGGKQIVHYRVPVSTRKTRADIDEVVDPAVRAALRKKFDELGGGGNLFTDTGKPPVLVTRTGKHLPIRRVRIQKVQTPVAVGGSFGRPPRYVISGANHHMEVLAELGPAGKVHKYRGATVSLLEAVKRKRQGAQIVQKDHGPALSFVFSLSEGDLVLGRRRAEENFVVWRVRAVRQDARLVLSRASDARQKAEISRAGDLWDVTLNTFMKLGARKVLVTHFGEIKYAND